MEIKNREVKIKSVQARNEAPSGWVSTRIALVSELSEEEIASLPFGNVAVLLAEESKRFTGKKASKGALKFSKPVEVFEVTVCGDGQRVKFRGKVELQPEMGADEGTPGLRIVFATEIELGEFAKLASLVGRSGVTWSVSGSQIDLFADATNEDRVLELARVKGTLSPTEAAGELGDVSAGSVRVYLGRLVEKGLLVQVGRGQYRATGALAQ